MTRSGGKKLKSTAGAMGVVSNSRGILTLDFIFALMLGMGFTIVFFAITLTLSHVEVAQYLSFSVARTAYAAHETRSLQISLGNEKYNQLRNRPIFKAIFNKGWFTIPQQPAFGNPLTGFNAEYQTDPNEDSENFIGARLTVRARILEFNSPFLGSTTTKPETGTANVQTFLGREVSTQECRENFNRQRWTHIITLRVGNGGATPYQAVGNQPGAPAQAVALITDNGC